MNKFKSNILTAGLALTGLCLGACSESFLDVSSKTESTTGNFYKTESDAWRALLGCYDGWRQVSSSLGGSSFYLISTTMSDECYGSTGNGDGRGFQLCDQFDQSQSPSDVQFLSDNWKVYYAGVYRCNEMLQHEYAWTDNAKEGLYLGECRALRALLYFDMVRTWGNIPLFTEPSEENRAQADPAEVYAVIVDDLKYAADNIPATANRGTSNFGRITKYAAESILARVYLFYTGYYGKEPGYTDAEGNTTGALTKAEALAAVEDVIANGGYSLVADFKDLWPAASLYPIPGELGWAANSTYAGDANSEIILSQNFTPTQDYNGNNDSNRWQVMMGMRSLNDVVNGYGKGWGACCVTPGYIAKFLKGDPRFTASVIDLEGEGVSKVDGYQTSVNDWREYTGYTVKKYSPMVFGNEMPATKPDGTAGFQECNPQPWNIVRYADVLLMAAELGSPQGNAYLTQVRTRAGLPAIALTQENIMDERARELAFEGHRYWDLLRQGVDVMADAVVATGGPVLNGGLEGTVVYSKDKIVKTKGLCQIPQDQITLSNGVLKQNEGWY